MAGQFHVVEFSEEGKLTIVPSLWLNGNTCKWPTYKGRLRVKNAVEMEEVPGENWTTHYICLLYSGTYEYAKRKLRKAEQMLGIWTTDDEIPSKRRTLTQQSLEDEYTSRSENSDEEGYPSNLTQKTYQEARNTRIIEMLEDIQEQQMENKRLLTLILSRLSAAELKSSSELPDGISLPLNTLEEMEQFNHRISEEQTSAAVIKYLAGYRGISVSETVASILEDVLTTDLAKKFTLKGTKGKKKFESLNLTQLMFRGSLAKFLCNGLPQLETDWSKWRIFFCDERLVPYDDAECTYTIYKKGLVEKVGMGSGNIFPINPELSVAECADDYEKKVREFFPGPSLPRFDMLLLGMGPDGHTCSLFPGHPLLQEKERIIAPISDSPKPPPSRVTMSLPVVNNCQCAVFASCGSGKAEMVQRVLEGSEDPPLPASLVRPSDGQLYWFLDKGAAANLTKTPCDNKL